MPEDDIRNKFLDAGDSDDGAGHGSESEDDFQKGGRNAKRRRLSDDEDSEADDFTDAEEEHDDDEAESKDASAKDGQDTTEGKEEKDGKKKKEKKSVLEGDLPGMTKPLTKKNLIVTEEAIKKSGVVYMSRVPPFMTPAKVRSLLEPYGKMNRIFLAPEDPIARRKRIRNGGNKKKSFTEGWIEFVKKKDAKKVCELLNARPIGGKKGSYYRDDIWNLLYLKGFKWHNLTEQIAAENAERASRMRAEISKTTKENKEFVRNVERAKVQQGIQAKKASKGNKEGGEGGATEVSETTQTATTTNDNSRGERRRTFKQIPLAKKRKLDEQQPEQVQRVLSKIF
ncbi:hypothetical protein SMACR_03753 [Sordaria macrospora]|uniref:18S rRNA factor 2 n=2 Tax=Sordaria macrospora TaxID=5147 RepID=F7VZU8_SORMK|nr:uncharacterized protein SMAC_03753 [Sordaria macrospora k-hell]KAA8629460.1 hypothetical protein SMACR_03753 [Sordaria macrospora]WPJ61606.1 hypothetical protein SMAC4_03753 [Sordaria macrospora]CCC11047.1 unnamed protein product [Sordaria macrospora k-hell]